MSQADVIEKAYENVANDSSVLTKPEVIEAIEQTIAELDAGKVRVAEPAGSDWQVNGWVKKAILLLFLSICFLI